jgi:CheY-like chemotaxis protein/DNA-directed RNA polymerase specialized sigma24 family protein
MVRVLPYLRRYTRALTGTKERGDRYVRQFLEAVLADPDLVSGEGDSKLETFKSFHQVCSGLDPAADPSVAGENADLELERQIAALPALDRQILLLVSLEGFSVANAAEILGIAADDAREKLLQARLDLQKDAGARVLVIEDEAVIAMDIVVTVRSAGHTVVGVADTEAKAVALSEEFRPDLILADVQLKDGDSGIDAVEKIMRISEVPVIFVTGFPEAFLTGDKVEPAFLLTKPFDPEALTATISQALAVGGKAPRRSQGKSARRRKAAA